MDANDRLSRRKVISRPISQPPIGDIVFGKDE